MCLDYDDGVGVIGVKFKGVKRVGVGMSKYDDGCEDVRQGERKDLML